METGLRRVVYFISLTIAAVVIALMIQRNTKDSYIHRAKIASVIISSSPLKIKVEEYYAGYGEFPQSNYSLNLPEPEEFELDGLRSLSIEPGGVIHIEIEGGNFQTSGHVFLIPKQLKDYFNDRWLCLTPSYPSIGEWMPQCEYKPVKGW